jgi:hypothetical protein
MTVGCEVGGRHGDAREGERRRGREVIRGQAGKRWR